MVKLVNYEKVREITQEKDENLVVFLSLVTEAFGKDTSTDTESTEGRWLLTMHFITKSAPDVRIKLPKLEAGPKPHYQPWQRKALKSIVTETLQGRPTRRGS